MSGLTELNNFVEHDTGVYGLESEHQAFNYSDGEQTEVVLRNILRSAQDLSSQSQELQAHITDWPTEYHLSKTRANLLRALNLNGVTKVLELGCGCGSISRYLGELEGVEVDAVEGSHVRAELAALRCRDLPNVTVSTANFNDIKLPAAHYDLVLFVGVTEYAGRFSSRETDQEALQDLLIAGKQAAKSDGAVLVAIENRLGMKYMLGACEDHYAVPYVGLENYPQSTGIRTYSKPEWLAQISQAGFLASRFLYPFPDYKVPTLMLTDKLETEQATAALHTLRSRDYSRAFDLGDQEYRIWQGLLEGGNLGDYSNSFLILLSGKQATLDHMAPSELQRFEPPELPYELAVPKPSVAVASESPQELAQLHHKITKLESDNASLQQRVSIMRGSIGWRLINVFRRLLGRPSI